LCGFAGFVFFNGILGGVGLGGGVFVIGSLF
jgi:hypothetical protein